MAKANKQVLLPMVRLAGNSLLKKSAFDDSKEPDYNGRVLFAKDSKAAAIFKAAMKEVFEEEFGKGAKPARNPLHSGDELEGKVGFDETVYYVNFKSDIRPALEDRSGDESIDMWEDMSAEDRELRTFPGCYGDLWIKLYAWGPGKFGKGVGVEVRGWRYRKDGERLGGTAPPTVNDFPDLDEEEEAGDDWL